MDIVKYGDGRHNVLMFGISHTYVTNSDVSCCAVLWRAVLCLGAAAGHWW
jgi:hypothetical protein